MSNRGNEEIDRKKTEAGLDLLDAISAAFLAGVVGSGTDAKHLLEMIVRTAADMIGATAASLYVVDKAAEELVFRVAIGPKAAEVMQFRLPIGGGIAGLVAATGQPMAISDAQNHPDLAAEISDKIGYRPNTMLCMPLAHGDEVVGVIQLLDKEDASSFTPDDMQHLALFAEQAAAALEQVGLIENISAFLIYALRSAGAVPNSDMIRSRIEAAAELINEDSAHSRSLKLASLIRKIAEKGDAEARFCEAVLSGVLNYLQAKPDLGQAR